MVMYSVNVSYMQRFVFLQRRLNFKRALTLLTVVRRRQQYGPWA